MCLLTFCLMRTLLWEYTPHLHPSGCWLCSFRHLMTVVLSNRQNDSRLQCAGCSLLNYDISISPFLPYAQRYMEREAHNYIRKMRTGYSIQSEFEYARLKKAMAIYTDLGGEYSEDTITKVSEQLGESYEKTKSIIEGGILTESYTDIQNKRDDDDEAESSIIVPDSSHSPENIYFKQELYDKLYEAYDGLEYTEKIMLAQHLGFCPECFSTRYADKNDKDENGKPKEKPIKPLPYTDIATDHGFSDADTAKRVCERALIKLKNPF